VNKMRVSVIKTKLEEYDRLQNLIDGMEKIIEGLTTEKLQVSSMSTSFYINTVFFSSTLADFLKFDIIELLKEKVEELKKEQRYMEIQ